MVTGQNPHIAALGNFVTLANLPTHAPGTSLDLFVEGWTEGIGHESYPMAFDRSPVGLGLGVWEFGVRLRRRQRARLLMAPRVRCRWRLRC